MSSYLNKNGLSINENGKFFTFCIIKLFKNDNRGNWMFRVFLFIPKLGMKNRYVLESFFRLRRKYMKEF